MYIFCNKIVFAVYIQTERQNVHFSGGIIMPKNKYEFKLTDEMKTQLQLDVAGLKTAGMLTKGTPKSAKTIMEIAKQNEPSGIHFLACCYIGPTHMSEILVSSGIKVDKMSLADQVYYKKSSPR